jgi:hypothetical protein
MWKKIEDEPWITINSKNEVQHHKNFKEALKVKDYKRLMTERYYLYHYEEIVR